jgi:putative protease
MPLKKKRPARKPAKKRPVKKAPARRKSTKGPAKRTSLRARPAVKRAALKPGKENIVGIVTHYFPKVRAAVVKLKGQLALGDKIKIKGHTTDFTQAVNSIQIDRIPINSAKKGQEIGLLTVSRVRQHDVVYRA